MRGCCPGRAFALPDVIRTATNLVPPVKDVRIIDIVGLAQQADGVPRRPARQVGRIEVVKIESKGNCIAD